MEQLINALEVLSAYFAVLLVLAVIVEVLVDLIKLLAGQRLSQRISPEQALKDIEEWLPEESKAKMVTILKMVSEFGIDPEMAQDTMKGNRSDPDTQKTPQSEVEKYCAQSIYTIRKKYNKEEARRVAILRVFSAILGIGIAWLLGLDTFNLLAALFPDEFLIPLNDGSNWAKIAHLGGMALTGAAASAGSSFWHDQLDRIRALKESVRKQEAALEENGVR